VLIIADHPSFPHVEASLKAEATVARTLSLATRADEMRAIYCITLPPQEVSASVRFMSTHPHPRQRQSSA
jgi:hypothetical protein